MSYLLSVLLVYAGKTQLPCENMKRTFTTFSSKNQKQDFATYSLKQIHTHKVCTQFVFA